MLLHLNGRDSDRLNDTHGSIHHQPLQRIPGNQMASTWYKYIIP
jgi:hypothetical protein